MRIFRLNSDFFLNEEYEGASGDVDIYNTDQVPDPTWINPRFIEGAWVDVTNNAKATIQETEKNKVALVITAIQYLKDTDWYASRKAETGKAIPDDVLTKRAEARINASSG